jgi:hypothetical protein
MIHAENIGGDLLPDDDVPESLAPIFQRMFDEHWPVLTDTAAQLGQWAQENSGPEVPRIIGEHEFSINGVTETRAILPHSIWKMQRPLDYYGSLSGEDKQQADEFLQSVGGFDALQIQLPVSLKRVQNKMQLAN